LSQLPRFLVLASAVAFALLQEFSVRHWTGSFRPSREVLYNGQLQVAIEHGNPEINRALVALFNEPAARGPILTPYAILLSFDQVRTFLILDSFETSNVFIRVATEGARYILDDMSGSPEVSAEFDRRRRAGEFQQISSGLNWQLLAVVR
jgi:hypothetical protein